MKKSNNRSDSFFEMYGYFSAEKFLVLAPVALTSHFKKESSLRG